MSQRVGYLFHFSQKETVDLVSFGEESDPESANDEEDDDDDDDGNDALVSESHAETKSRTKIKLVFKSKKGAKG